MKFSDPDVVEIFDPNAAHEAYFEKTIAPMLDEILKLCAARGLPCFAAFQLDEFRIANSYNLPEGVHSKMLELGSVLEPSVFIEMPEATAKA